MIAASRNLVTETSLEFKYLVTAVSFESARNLVTVVSRNFVTVTSLDFSRNLVTEMSFWRNLVTVVSRNMLVAWAKNFGVILFAW